MTHAEQETIEIFCRELALALRKITGKNIKIRPELLPKIDENQTVENIDKASAIDLKPVDQK
jgi:hypothetical protein